MFILFLVTVGKQLSCQRKDQSVPESCQEPPPIDVTRQINCYKPALSCFVFKRLKKVHHCMHRQFETIVGLS